MSFEDNLLLKQIIKFSLLPALIFSITGTVFFHLIFRPLGWALYFWVFGFLYSIFLFLFTVILIVFKHHIKNNKFFSLVSALFFFLILILAVFVPMFLFCLALGLLGGT